MTTLGVVLMAVGILAVMRSVIIVAGNGSGRFAGDALVSFIGGFGLCLLGQALLT